MENDRLLVWLNLGSVDAEFFALQDLLKRLENLELSGLLVVGNEEVIEVPENLVIDLVGQIGSFCQLPDQLCIDRLQNDLGKNPRELGDDDDAVGLLCFWFCRRVSKRPPKVPFEASPASQAA